MFDERGRERREREEEEEIGKEDSDRRWMCLLERMGIR